MRKKATSTHKKVIAETSAGERLQGYVKFPNFAGDDGLELLDSAGQQQKLPWKSMKILWLVRDWEDSTPPLEQTAFPRRPRVEGLWVRLRFRDDTAMEGILVNELLDINPYGFLVTPPTFNGNTHTAFVPRAALKSAEILSVVGGPARQAQRRRPRAAVPGQTRLFEP